MPSDICIFFFIRKMIQQRITGKIINKGTVCKKFLIALYETKFKLNLIRRTKTNPK